MINNQLIKSNEDSRFLVIVFSMNYASSSWCLDELVKIMECQKAAKQTAYPVFYDVEPTKVRKQSGLVGEAFEEYKNKEFAGKWREALKEAADLAGWELKKTANGADEKLVGMEMRINDVLSSLKIRVQDVRMIRIKGIGGGGKTTLARAVYDQISNQFKGKSFVENLEALCSASNWFKPGSRIIITTRDEQLVVAYRVNFIHIIVYKINMLSADEAICLFIRYAFEREIPFEEYKDLSGEVVKYDDGLPLTIKVLDIAEWFDEKIEDMLANDLGTKATKCIKLRTKDLNVKGLANLKELRFLIVFSLNNEVSGNEDDCYGSDQESDEVLHKLRFLDIFDLKVRTLDLRLTLNLEMLHIIACEDLVELWMPIESLKLRSINLTLTLNLDKLCLINFHDLVKLLMPTESQNLRILKLNHSKLKTFFLGIIPNLVKLILEDCNYLVELHRPIKKINMLAKSGNLRSLKLSNSKLRILDLEMTLNLIELILEDSHFSRSFKVEDPSPQEYMKSYQNSICMLIHLKSLKLPLCDDLEKLPEDIGRLECLEELYLSSKSIRNLQDNIYMLKHLKSLEIRCFLLEKIAEDIGQLECLERLSRAKDGKRFGFVRFINVFNVERLVSNLCTIWVDRSKFHANIARFHRAPLNNNKVPTEQKFGYNRNINNVRAKEGVTTSLSKSYVHAVKVKNMFGALECDSMPSIVLDDECLISKDLSKALLGRVQDFVSLPNLKIVLKNKGVGSWFSVLKQTSSDLIPEGRIGELLDVDDQEKEGFHSKRLYIYLKSGTNIYENFKVIFWGKVFFIRAKEVPGWVPKFVDDSDDDDESDNGFKDGDAKVQDGGMCGNDSDEVEVPKTVFKESLEQKGVWLKTGVDILMVVVYAPQDLRDKRANVFNAFIANAGLEEESQHDYGPISFRFFSHWLKLDGFNKLVTDMWNLAPIDESNAMRNVMIKLKFLKRKIQEWINDNKNKSKSVSDQFKEELQKLDANIDKGIGSDDIINKRLEVLNSIQHLDKIKAIDVAQKAKIKWAIEGDENTRYFHRMDLECAVSKEELKRAVWEYGTDKSPGPDGLSFGFYRQFWSSIENDMFAAVSHFFTFGDIPNGCNSCFIALILKVPDANLVKDFRPISLIGSMYNIIAKILANRLVGVLGDIVNEVQSAFITERKILDGPFILNEAQKWEETCLGCKLGRRLSISNKASWVKWKSVLASKEKGGLGVSSLYALNRALWARVIKAIYSDDGQVGKVSRDGSKSCWRNLLNEVRILSNQETKKEVTINSKMSDTRMENSLRRSIRVEGSREFSVASIWNIIDDNRLLTVDTRTLWIKYVPIKVNVLAWKIKIEAFPTRFNISRRGINIDSILCNISECGFDSVRHVFFSCSLVRQIVRKVCSWWDVMYIDVNSYVEWFNWMNPLRLKSKSKLTIEGVFYVVWWHV
uniref:TMV resistance protein N-like n=1 Tax=Tanacetum cinerariifolium TaxID=118510 RepID=A0A6L2KMY6_TANCI|nr:TMV resistance protein N-like [Tanacetum cinerariifolium]